MEKRAATRTEGKKKKQLVACAGGEHHFLGHTIKTVASGKWCDTPPQQGEKTG